MMDGKHSGTGRDIPLEIDGVDIAISGTHEENAFARDAVRAEVVKSVEKVMKVSDLTRFKVNVKKADDEGGRARYTILVNATADGAEFHADHTEWDLQKAVSGVLGKLEREIFREEDRKKPF